MFPDGSVRVLFYCRIVALLALLLLAQHAMGATVVFHTGTVDSVPAGTGEVAVYFDSTSGGKIFLETTTHLMAVTYDQGTSEAPIAEAVFNSTPSDLWLEYQIALLGADFYGTGSGLPAPVLDPIEMGGSPGDATIDFYPLDGTVTIASSQILRDGENALLNIVFDDPVSVGESFILVFDVQDIGEPGLPGALDDGFAVQQTPIIPEPTTAMVLIVGIGGLGRLIRRRRGKTKLESPDSAR